MGWWMYFIIVFTTTLLLVPINEWKGFIIAGLAGMLIILPIDGVLISLGAFYFNYNGLKVLGLPLPYWISYFPGGILFAHFHPTAWMKRALYILLVAAFFASVEFITTQLGLFQHVNWNFFKSLILNIIGFTTFAWFIEWFYSERREGQT